MEDVHETAAIGLTVLYKRRFIKTGKCSGKINDDTWSAEESAPTYLVFSMN